MKKILLLAAACLAASLAQAAPPIQPELLQLRARVQSAHDLGQAVSSMYNPRFSDGNIYAVQINFPCFGRYPSGSSTISAGVVETTRATRMVSSFRGAYSSTYMLASGGNAALFTRYDFDGTNPQDVTSIDTQEVESFDWVNSGTIICTDYTSGNRKRLYLVNVTANPFAVTKNTTGNANGYITSAASTRIRNVRVGQTDPNYAYYGDNGVADNPK